MIRVLHVICDLSGGGAERLVLDLCREGLVHQEVAPVHGEPRVLAEAFRLSGIRVHPGTRERGTTGLTTVARIARLARGFDLVHTHLYAGDTWGRPAAWLAGKPVVTTEHNVNRDESRSQRLVKRTLAPLTEHLAYVSEAARRYAIDHERICHPHTRVIPNGIDLTRFQRVTRVPAPQGPVRLLAVGRDVQQKGFDILVRALPSGVHLRIAGATRQAPGLRVVGEAATMEWLGERDDVPELLAETDILVVPSRWEGFGLAALEGMAAGVAVVASNVDGLPDVLGDVGVLVAKEDPAQLRRCLASLAGDAPERDRRGALGRQRAEVFSIKSCAERYAALYAEVIASRDAADSRPFRNLTETCLFPARSIR